GRKRRRLRGFLILDFGFGKTCPGPRNLKSKIQNSSLVQRVLQALGDQKDLGPRDLGSRSVLLDALERGPGELHGKGGELDQAARRPRGLQGPNVLTGDSQIVA